MINLRHAYNTNCVMCRTLMHKSCVQVVDLQLDLHEAIRVVLGDEGVHSEISEGWAFKSFGIVNICYTKGEQINARNSSSFLL